MSNTRDLAWLLGEHVCSAGIAVKEVTSVEQLTGVKYEGWVSKWVGDLLLRCDGLEEGTTDVARLLRLSVAGPYIVASMFRVNRQSRDYDKLPDGGFFMIVRR